MAIWSNRLLVTNSVVQPAFRIPSKELDDKLSDDLAALIVVAQATGTGDNGAQIDLIDTSSQLVTGQLDEILAADITTKSATLEVTQDVSQTKSDTLEVTADVILAFAALTEHADVTTAMAAAQAIGAGDASAEIDTCDTDWQAYIAAAAGACDIEAELVAMQAAVTAAQAIGAGDASAEIDTMDTAWVAYLAAVTKETEFVNVETDFDLLDTSIAAGIVDYDAVDAAWVLYLAEKVETESNTLVAAVAAAQAKGTGDASAEIDTLDTAAVALAALLGNAVSGVEVVVDLSTITTISQLRKAFELALVNAQGSGAFTE